MEESATAFAPYIQHGPNKLSAAEDFNRAPEVYSFSHLLVELRSPPLSPL